MQVDLARRVALLQCSGDLARVIGSALALAGAEVVVNDGRDPAEAMRRHRRVDLVVADATEDAQGSASLIRAAADTMRDGRIIAIVSIAGIVPMRGEASRCASQAGVIALIQALAMEVAEAGVLVNAVAIGAIADEAGDVAEADRRMLSHVPLERPGTRADIADAVLFLADPDNSYTTGHVLRLDGGWSAGYARDF